MAKYIVDLPKEYTSKSALLGEILSIPIQINGSKNYNIPTAIKITPYTESDRGTIEDEVWEFAWKIYSMDIGEYAEIFDNKGCSSDYREAKAKYEEWKKQKDDIHVKDEVICEACTDLEDGVICEFHTDEKGVALLKYQPKYFIPNC